MKQAIVFLLLSSIILTSCSSFSEFNISYFDTLQEACDDAWGSCEILQVINDQSVFLFVRNDAPAVALASFHKNSYGYIITDTTTMGVGRLTSGRFTHCNFKEISSFNPKLNGEFLYGYVADPNIKNMLIKYHIPNQGMEDLEEIVPVVNNTYYFFDPIDDMHIIDQITPLTNNGK